MHLIKILSIKRDGKTDENTREEEEEGEREKWVGTEVVWKKAVQDGQGKVSSQTYNRLECSQRC